MEIVLITGKVLRNVKAVYFAEDGKLDVAFTDGKEPATLFPTVIKEIKCATPNNIL